MKLSLRFMRPLLPLIAPALLAGCFQSVQPTPPVAAARPNYDLVAAIRAAGEREKSIIDVSPLREPAVTALQDAAAADERAGRYADAAAKLDQALKLSPESPDLLQERAELAVRLRDFAAAERLAHQSWTLGPQLRRNAPAGGRCGGCRQRPQVGADLPQGRHQPLLSTAPGCSRPP
jgi:tetratricopeptide (TPR) repeat protein